MHNFLASRIRSTRRLCREAGRGCRAVSERRDARHSAGVAPASRRGQRVGAAALSALAGERGASHSSPDARRCSLATRLDAQFPIPHSLPLLTSDARSFVACRASRRAECRRAIASTSRRTRRAAWAPVSPPPQWSRSPFSRPVRYALCTSPFHSILDTWRGGCS